MIELSIVIPVYRETECLTAICDQFEKCIPKATSYELVFVNDGGVRNEVYKALEALRSRECVRVVHLSRNFGQHIAIAAGMKNAQGAHVLVMDADLQYLPKDCYEMYRWALQQKASAVLTLLPIRAHSAFRRLGSKLYYGAMTKLGMPQRGDLGSVFLVSRHVARGLLRISDRYRMTIPMIHWISGDISYYEIPHQERPFGRSGYTIRKLIWHALYGITSFSATPLYFAFYFSMAFAALAFGILVSLVVRRLVFGEVFLSGWLSTIVVVLIASTVILTSIGIMGLYLASIFASVTGRPLYFVQEDEQTARLFEEQA